MPMTVALYKKLEEVEPQLRGVLFAILEEIEQQREETVTKVEFNELKEIVRDLAKAQKQIEVNIVGEATRNGDHFLIIGECKAQLSKNADGRSFELNENLRGLEKYATRAPDLAIDIVSDDDKVSAVFAKARLYSEGFEIL